MALFTFKSKGSIKRLVDLVYPVGSLYMSTNSTNPSTLFGGTWQAYAQGRCLIGAGEGDDGSTSMSFTAGAEYGEYLHSLDKDENGKHNHYYYSPIIQQVQQANNGTVYGNYNKQYKIQTDDSGEGKGHNNIQPCIGVYIWRRVS